MKSSLFSRILNFIGLTLILASFLWWLITRDWQSLVPTGMQVLLFVLGGLIYFIPKILGTITHWRSSAAASPIPPVLQAASVEDLLLPLGRGGRVSYLFRHVVDSNNLIHHRHLIITGETGSGKTRTAIELIRRLILEDIIPVGGVYVPDPAFQYLNRAELRGDIEKIQAAQPVSLLFIDNMPGKIPEYSLEILSDLISFCEPALVLVTARIEDLWEHHRRWLAHEAFLEIRLENLEKDQVKRLVDLASGAYNLQINDVARSVFADHLESSPGRLITAFQRLANRLTSYVTPDQVLPHTLGSTSDSLVNERTHLTEGDPASQCLLEALACFRAANLPLDVPFITQFAKSLWDESRPQRFSDHLSSRLASLNKAIPKLQALEISQSSERFAVSQIALDGLVNPEIATQKLEVFFYERGRSTPDWIQRRTDSYASRQAWHLFLLGGAAQKKNDLERATLLFSKAIAIQPHGWFLSHRSVAYASQEKLEQAVADANRAIQLDQHSAPAYTIRANSFLLVNKFDSAIEDYSKAIELDPKDAHAWLNRGNAYFAKEDIEKAISDFDTALQIVPGLPAAVMARAKAHNVRGRMDQAIADYDQAIAFNPEDTQLLYSRASAYDAIGDYSRAIAEYNKVIDLNPKDSQAFYNRGKAYHMLGKLDQAVLDYEQAILTNPRSAIAYRNRANALIRLNRLMEAKSDCREAEHLEPNHPYTHARWGQYFAAREDYIGAVEKYQLAARMIGNPTHFNLDIALCLLCSGNSTEGLARLKERLRKGAGREELEEALRDYEAQLSKREMTGMREAVDLLRQALARTNQATPASS
jgi:tetratricopeptide (TPR) repeat protein